MTPTITKGTAVFLLCLALSPFTAPFSTCDLATFIAGSEGHTPPAPAAVTTSRSDTTVSRVVGIRRDLGRLRLIASFCCATSEALSNRFAAVLGRAGTSSGGAPASPYRTILRI